MRWCGDRGPRGPLHDQGEAGPSRRDPGMTEDPGGNRKPPAVPRAIHQGEELGGASGKAKYAMSPRPFRVRAGRPRPKSRARRVPGKDSPIHVHSRNRTARPRLRCPGREIEKAGFHIRTPRAAGHRSPWCSPGIMTTSPLPPSNCLDRGATRRPSCNTCGKSSRAPASAVSESASGVSNPP